MNIRRLSNGEYYFPRTNREVVEYMDARYERTGKYTWRDRVQYNLEGYYEDLKTQFGSKAYVVGKGSSVDGLTPSHFVPNVPIFCTNEAVMLIDAMGLDNLVIGVRQDGKNRYYTPTNAWMLIKRDISAYYCKHEKTIPWDYLQLGIQNVVCTCAVILRLCNLYGVKDVTLYGFDAHTSGDLSYSDCSDVDDRREANTNLKNQHASLIKYSEGLRCKWMKSDLENYLTEL